MENNIEKIIEKLNKIEYNKNPWKNWTLEEIKNLLEIYYVISKKESYLFDLIYIYHGSDSYEDIFRDYDTQYLHDKTDGVKEALDYVNETLQSKNKT